MTSRGMADNPSCLASGTALCRAHCTAYKLEMAPPGAKMPSPAPCSHPTPSRILVSTISSINVNTGAISYVNLYQTYC